MSAINWPVRIDGEPFERTCLRVQQWADGIFIWEDDQKVWGVPEFWATADELEANFIANNGRVIGDCDDRAGLCVHALRLIGVEARYLTCWTELGGYHCPCVARHDGEALVLDNRFGPPMTREQLYLIGYKFDRMSGANPNDPNDPWTKVV